MPCKSLFHNITAFVVLILPVIISQAAICRQERMNLRLTRFNGLRLLLAPRSAPAATLPAFVSVLLRLWRIAKLCVDGAHAGGIHLDDLATQVTNPFVSCSTSETCV